MNAIPLSQPDITEAEVRIVVQTLRGGRLSMGPRLEEFEGQTPESFDGLLEGGHTAKALITGVLRLALRVYMLEEQVEKKA